MKWGQLIKKISYSTWFLATIPAIVIMLLLPSLGSRYKLVIDPVIKNGVNHIYADLNGDSISELILYGKSIPFFYVTVRNTDNLIYDQWNIADSLNPAISEIFTGNFDHDQYREIYVFSYKADSLFLNVNEILQPSGKRMDRIFITKIGFLNGETAATVSSAGFFDTDGDGSDELYFSISSYFQSGPRRLYYFDLKRKELKSSESFGTICLFPRMADTDGDHKPEIFGIFSASGNYSKNVPYSDSSTWLMIFDDKLRFKFPPVEFPGFANGLYTLPYENGNFRGYVLSHLANGADTSVLKSRIMLFSREGKLIRDLLYNSFTNSRYKWTFVINSPASDRICVLADKLYELNNKLEIIRTIKIPFSSTVVPFQADLNGDGKDELLLYSQDEEKLVAYNADLHRMAEQIFLTEDMPWKFYPYLSGDHDYSLFFTTGKNGQFLKLIKNNFYFLSYFLYPAIYLTFLLFIVLIKRIGTSQQKAKEDLNSRLITLQLQGIKSQLDPHFTFNTLNSIASLIYLEDRQAAYDYMRKFTELLRSMLNDAEKIYRNLGEEIEFVTTYLELEKLRFGEKFNYVIEISPDVSQREQVPKLVLQTFTENAVKHGIMPTESGGLIKIYVAKEKDYLKMTIEDNGIGREHAAGHSDSTGKGLKLTSEFYEILNQINKRPIIHHITDLYNNSSEPSGTRVDVWVPVDDFPNFRIN